MNNYYNLSSTTCEDEFFNDGLAEVKYELLIVSIFFDLIGGIISSLFTYQIYQGVEISHPVYSVVFSNNLLANILSFLIFLTTIVRQYMECCTCNYVAWVIYSTVFFMNCICWTIVAVLRYHLLITAKKQVDNGEIEMMKITKAALVCYWGLMILLSVTRATLIVVLGSGGKRLIRWVGTLLIVLSSTLVTMVVYYRLDVELEAMKNITNEEDKIEPGEAETHEVRASKKEAHRNIPRRLFEMKVQPPDNSKTESNRNLHISKGTYKENAAHDTALRSKIPSLTSSITHISASLQKTIEKPFGGIYVGEEEMTNKPVSTDIIKLKNDKGQMSDVRTPSKNEKIQSTSEDCAFYDSTLPNEVSQTGKNSLNSAKIKVIFSSIHAPKEDIKAKVNDNETPNDQNNAPDRIDVDQDWIEEAPPEPGNNRSETEDGHKDKSGLERHEYRNSKEHKSIKKAFIVNWLFLGCLTAVTLVGIVIFKKSSNKGNAILLVKSTLAIYRTLTPIISSIYCFEVIHCLFQRILEAAIDNLRNVYNMARGLF